jgi:ABC-type sulfate transport system substrate-binding protein
MPVLKFDNDYNNDNILFTSTDHKMLDITNDPRSKLLPKNDIINNSYKIDTNVYIAKNNFFIEKAQYFHGKNIAVLYMKYKTSHLIVVGNNAYVYYNGKSISVNDYNIGIDMSLLDSLISANLNL